jgi:hypothetical protein
MRLAAVFLVLVAIAGCGETRSWVKAGATEEQFSRDHRECSTESSHTDRRIALGGRAGSFHDAAVVRQDVYDACMEARGYTSEIGKTGWRGTE